MRLSGWTEIAEYLKVGIRTAQRWHEDLHLPVMRTGNNVRGPVVAESERLDEWQRRRSSLTGLTERTSAIIKRTAEEGRNFLRAELVTGREFAKLAAKSSTAQATTRRIKAARKAYDTISRLLSHSVALPEGEREQFRKNLQDFKRDLEKLGEKF